MDRYMDRSMDRRAAGLRTQRSTQASLVPPPEVVLPAVDESHRDLLAVPLLQGRVVEDGDLLVGLPQVGADPLDHRTGVVAEMAPRLGVEENAAHSSRPSARRRSVARSRP